MTRRLLDEAEISTELAARPNWGVAEKALAREFVWPSFLAAVEFINAIAVVAERLDHHPDLDLRYRRVLVRTWTHSAGGLTALDFALAAEIDAIAAR